MATNNNRYIIMCQARTGSTMLATALSEHPDVCAHGEVLNTRTDNTLEFYGLDYRSNAPLLQLFRNELFRDPAKYLDRWVFQQADMKACGFKFKYEEMSNPCFSEALAYVLRNKDIKVLHVRRKNLWKRFLSEYIAVNVTKIFNATEKAIEVPKIEFELAPSLIQSAFEKTRHWERMYGSLFNNHKVKEFFYEDFSKSPVETFNGVTGFLNIDKYDFIPRTKKIVKKQTEEEMIVNLEDIKKYFQNTEFSKFFK